MNQTNEQIKQINFLIEGKHSTKELPNYHDYAYVVEKIGSFLKENFEDTFQMYIDEDGREEVWDVLSEDIRNNSSEVKSLANVYECVETKIVYSKHLGTDLRFYVQPNLQNAIYYYENYKVALVKIYTYHNDGETLQDLIFAVSDAGLLDFYNYIYKKQREYLKNHVTVFVDQDGDIQRKKEEIQQMVHREDVYMDEATKVQIYRSIDEFFSNSREFYQAFNVPYKRGILLYGKPGNGKTTLVKSIAGSINAPVVYWQITEFTSSYSIAEVFQTTTSMAPMVLVIEDIDSMPENVRSVFLNALDGATSKEGVFLIGTTNYPEKIDPALINRAGRFDRAYEIKLPSVELRQEYLIKKGIEKLIDAEQLKSIIQKTEGFSFAQLNELFASAALQWHYEHKVDVAAILKELATDNIKGRKLDWISENNKVLGFAR